MTFGGWAQCTLDCEDLIGLLELPADQSYIELPQFIESQAILATVFEIYPLN